MPDRRSFLACLLGGAWLYPSQLRGWHPVGPEKLASWFLLMLVSSTLAFALEGRGRRAP